jgi:hypothetical protein
LGCSGDLFQRPKDEHTPVVDRAATSGAVLSEYLQLLQRLVQGTPSDQAEIVAAARHDYESAPTPSRQLRLALILGTPAHPAYDAQQAQGLLRELMANPETLVPGERALAFLELQQIDDHLNLVAENRKLHDDGVSRERLAAANHRLQVEADENARLRKELDEARAKLETIINIERSVDERKNRTQTTEGRPQ